MHKYLLLVPKETAVPSVGLVIAIAEHAKKARETKGWKIMEMKNKE